MSLLQIFADIEQSESKTTEKEFRAIETRLIEASSKIAKISGDVGATSRDDFIVVPKALFDPRYLEDGGRDLMIEEIIKGKDYSDDPETIVLTKSFCTGLQNDWKLCMQNFTRLMKTANKRAAKGKRAAGGPKKPNFSMTTPYYADFFGRIEMGIYDFNGLDLADHHRPAEEHFNPMDSIRDAKVINSTSPLSYMGTVKSFYGTIGNRGSIPKETSADSIIKFPNEILSKKTLKAWQTATKEGNVPETDSFVWKNIMTLASIFKVLKNDSLPLVTAAEAEDMGDEEYVVYDPDEINLEYDRFKIASTVFAKKWFAGATPKQKKAFQRDLFDGQIPLFSLGEERSGAGTEVVFTDGTSQTFPNYDINVEFVASE